MKKTIAFTIIAFFLFSLCACGTNMNTFDTGAIKGKYPDGWAVYQLDESPTYLVFFKNGGEGFEKDAEKRPYVLVNYLNQEQADAITNTLEESYEKSDSTFKIRGKEYPVYKSMEIWNKQTGEVAIHSYFIIPKDDGFFLVDVPFRVFEEDEPLSINDDDILAILNSLEINKK